MDPAQWVAFAGYVQQGSSGIKGSPQIRQVKQLIIDSSKDEDDSAVNKVALIQLSDPLDINASVKPICIAQESPKPGQMCITAGWSSNTKRGKFDYFLLYKVKSV